MLSEYNYEKVRDVIYIDMDNVIVDFKSGIEAISETLTPDKIAEIEQAHKWDEVPGIFGLMKPVDGAIEAVMELTKNYEVYILSTAPWKNPSAWSDKVDWVHRYFENIDDEQHPLYKRLILTHNKDLHIGDWLIDDRLANGADAWLRAGLIHFGPEDQKEKRDGDFPNWAAVLRFFALRLKRTEPLSDGQEDAPMDLLERVAAIYQQGRSLESAYDAIQIPYKYTESVDNAWENMEKYR